MKVVVGAASDVGRARERNEDSYLAMPPVYIVADGMGGHRGGNVASSLAMQVMSGLAQNGNPDMLPEQVRQANQAILERSRADRDLQGMGTTITATYFANGVLHLAQVGDSRAYLVRGGQMSQVTTDHTLVHEMVKRQQITPEEAEHHPQRSILTRALGVDDPVEVDSFEIQSQVGDRLLLCSDGLHSMVEDTAIHQVLQEEPIPQVAADRLVALANEAGGLDNITVVVMDFAEGEGFEGATWVPTPPPGEVAATKETPIPQGLGGDLTAAYQVPAAGAGAAAAAAPPPPVGAPPASGPAPPMPGPEPDDTPPYPTPAAAPQYTAPAPQYAAPVEAGRHRGRGRRTVLWVVGVLVLLAVIGVGGRLYLDSRYFVGVENGKVAVFRGLPTKTLGVKLFGVVEVSGVPGQAAIACAVWRQPLHDGITESSLEAARAKVAQIQADVAKGCGVTTGTSRPSGGSSSSSPT